MPSSQRHILGVFEDAIQSLKDDIRRMADLALGNLASAVRGLLERNEDFCNRAIANDDEVDALEMKIDKEALEIIMKFSPVAGDLRRVISTMKMSTSLERISDHAVSLARRA
jgi:phosphate transport system protein